MFTNNTRCVYLFTNTIECVYCSSSQSAGIERVVEVKFFNMSYGISGFAWRTGQDRFFACVSPEKGFRLRAFPNTDGEWEERILSFLL